MTPPGVMQGFPSHHACGELFHCSQLGMYTGNSRYKYSGERSRHRRISVENVKAHVGGSMWVFFFIIIDKEEKFIFPFSFNLLSNCL